MKNTKDNSLKLQQESIQLNIMKKFFSVMSANTGIVYSKKAVQYPSHMIFRYD